MISEDDACACTQDILFIRNKQIIRVFSKGIEIIEVYYT